MKINKVIKTENFPTRLPFASTLMWLTMLHYWNAPEWLWGVFGLLFFVLWCVAIKNKWKEEQVDIFEKDKTNL